MDLQIQVLKLPLALNVHLLTMWLFLWINIFFNIHQNPACAGFFFLTPLGTSIQKALGERSEAFFFMKLNRDSLPAFMNKI